ncbi:MAG: tetratricopeptide repeat protein [Candidatus Thorarchaeota archaeon]
MFKRISWFVLGSLFLFFIYTLCFSQIDTSKVTIKIALIDFLYVLDSDSMKRNFEQDILIPAIDKCLNLTGTKNYQFEIKRVTKGQLNYFTRSSAELVVSKLDYDIAIWGYITTFDNSLKDYNLQLMVFTNPNKINPCIFYHEFIIRNSIIMMWNNKECNISETSCAVIPSILCFKLRSFINKDGPKLENKDIQYIINTKLLPLIGNVSLENVTGWHPDQKCDTSFSFGTLIIDLADGNQIFLPLHYSIYFSMYENIKNAAHYNWSVNIVPSYTSNSIYDSLIQAKKIAMKFYQQVNKEDINEIDRRRIEHLNKMNKNVVQYPDNNRLRNELAVTYALIGETQKAKEQYKVILEKDKTNFFALNNLANVYFLEGILDSAQYNYAQALENAPTFRDSNGVYLNLGILFYAADTVELTYEMFANVARDINDTTKIEATLFSRVADLLELPSNEVNKSEEKEKKLKKVSPKKVKQLVKETIEKKIKPKGYKISRTSATKQRRPKEDIEDVFFWVY